MNIKRKQFIRYVITGNQADRDKAFQYCQKHQLYIIRSGPMPKGRSMYDLERFKIIAEREGES